jgi:APA family basic amino acid/polyamine antiporter
MIGWTDWINGTVAAGFMAVVFAEYMQRLGFATALPMGLVAVTLIGGVWVVNWTGTRTCGASQGLGTSLKGLGLLALIALLFAAPTETSSAAPPASSSLSLAALIVALRAVSNTYAGWHTGLYFCEELKRPERNIVRATFGGLALITCLYLLANAAMLQVLTPEQMANSKLPAADAAATVYGDRSALLITGLAIVSIVAIANLYLMFLTRIAFAMARDRVLPSVFARVSSTGTPASALFLTAATAAAFAATGVYERLIAIAAPTTIILYAAMDLAAVKMRYREPSLPRPYRMPWFPLPALCGLGLNLLLLFMVFYEDPWNSTLGVGLVAIIGLAYKLPLVARFKEVKQL